MARHLSDRNKRGWCRGESEQRHSDQVWYLLRDRSVAIYRDGREWKGKGSNRDGCEWKGKGSNRDKSLRYEEYFQYWVNPVWGSYSIRKGNGAYGDEEKEYGSIDGYSAFTQCSFCCLCANHKAYVRS